MRFIKTCILLAFLQFGIAAFAGPTTISAKLDSANLLMGRQIGMHVEIVQDKGATGYIPLVDGDTLVTNVEIVGWRNSDTTDLGNDRIQIDKDLILQSFDSGLYVLPPILYISGKDTLRTARNTLKVVPVNVDTLKTINDYKPVADPNTRWTDYLPDFITDYWWLFLLAIVAAAIVAYVIYRVKKGKPVMPPLIPKKKLLPPYEEAMAALSELKSATLWEQGQEKEYYTRLTDILRRYIDRRFNVNAMELTTTQILKLLNHDEVEGAKSELREILNLSDFVKFAKMKPLADENEQAYRLAKEFLDKTKPVEQPADAKPDAGKGNSAEEKKDDVDNSNNKRN